MSSRRALLMSRRKRYHKYLIGYYPFDNDFNDKKAPHVDLSEISSNISIESGRIGNSAYAAPGTNGVLRNDQFPSKYVFDDGIGTVPYTISMQIKMISAGSQDGTIVGLSAMGSSSYALTNAVWWVGVTDGLSSINFRKYSLTAGLDYTGYRVENPPVNEWFQLTISDDAQGNVKIWFENTLQTAIVTNEGTGFVRFAIGSASRFGLFNAVGEPRIARFLEAYVDDLAIFKGYAFTQADVDYVNNNGNPRKIL